MRFQKSRKNVEFFIVVGLYGLSIVSVVTCTAIAIAGHHIKADIYAAGAATPGDALVSNRHEGHLRESELEIPLPR